MKRTMRLLMLAGALLAATSGQAMAYDLAFNFSFTSDVTNSSLEALPGTVTGLIVLATDNTVNEAAQHIYISTTPSYLPGGAFAADATTWNQQSVNSFTITNGVITSALFDASSYHPGSDLTSLIIDTTGSYLGDNLMQSLAEPSTSALYGNQLGATGISFTPANLSTPEPSSLVIAGLAGVCGIAYVVANKRRAARNNTSAA